MTEHMPGPRHLCLTCVNCNQNDWCAALMRNTTVTDVYVCSEYTTTSYVTMAAWIKELEKQRDALVEAAEALLDPEYCQALRGNDDADESTCYSIQTIARAALAMVAKKEGE